MALPSLCYINHVLEPPDFRPQWICSCRISISNYVIILFCAKCYKVAWFSRWNSAHTSFFHRVSKITDTNCTSRFFFFSRRATQSSIHQFTRYNLYRTIQPDKFFWIPYDFHCTDISCFSFCYDSFPCNL